MRKVALLSAAALLAACSDASNTAAPRGAADLRVAASLETEPSLGGVFVETNAADGNAVVAFARHADGSLTPSGTYATGGNGTGGGVDPLTSQFAVALAPGNEYLYAVNAGSNSVAAFAVRGGTLRVIGTYASNGERPVSVATYGRLVYVLNAASGTLAGFQRSIDGSLVPVPSWTRTLSASATGAAEARFSRDGRTLVVTERTSRSIDSYRVLPDGSLSDAIANASSGSTPFGFDFTPRGQLVVSEAGAKAASSYTIGGDRKLSVVTASSPTYNTAPCWAIVTNDGRFAYIANAGSSALTGYAVAANGALSILDPAGVSAALPGGSTPLDLDVTRDGRFVFVLEAGSGKVAGFAIGRDGALSLVSEVPAVAAASGQMGLAAYGGPWGWRLDVGCWMVGVRARWAASVAHRVRSAGC